MGILTQQQGGQSSVTESDAEPSDVDFEEDINQGDDLDGEGEIEDVFSADNGVCACHSSGLF